MIYTHRVQYLVQLRVLYCFKMDSAFRHYFPYSDVQSPSRSSYPPRVVRHCTVQMACGSGQSSQDDQCYRLISPILRSSLATTSATTFLTGPSKLLNKPMVWF